jgi:hypothetical protein
MKRILTFVVCMLVAGVAYAGWNISQRDDGGTAWENGTGVRVGVGGGTVIVIPVYNIKSAATQYYTVHRPGAIVRAYLTATTTLISSTTPVISLYIVSQATPQSAIVTTQVTGLNNVQGMTEGILTIVTGTVGHTEFQLYNSGNAAARGNLIAVVPTTIGTGGTGSGTVANGPDVYITIIIE